MTDDLQAAMQAVANSEARAAVSVVVVNRATAEHEKNLRDRREARKALDEIIEATVQSLQVSSA